MATVWYGWCDSTTTSGFNIIYDPWQTWTSTASDTTWTIWTGDPTAATTCYAIPRLTEEEQRQMQEQNERYHKQAVEERKKRRAAEDRAQKLLEENLSLQERDRLRKDGHIVVQGRLCRYRLRRARSANVDVIDKDGFITHRLCAHPAELVPDHDTMLAQKLMLEHDEDAFNRIANKHQHYGTHERVLPQLQ